MPPLRIKPTGPRIGGGPPILTMEQFHLARPNAPKGGYANYLKFINTRRGYSKQGGGAPWPGGQGPGLPTYESLIKGLQFETPAQVEARARRMTNESIAAQQKMIGIDAQRERDDALKLMQAQSAAGRAAAQLNAGLFGRVGGEYNAAAQEMSGMATNLAGAAGTTTAQDVANINTALGRVGAPGVEATGALAGPGQAAVEAYKGGALPAQNLVTQGQSAQFGLAGLVAAQNLRATQEAQAGLRSTTGDLDRARRDATMKLALGRPGLAAENLKSLQDSQRQQVALAMSLIGARRGALQTGFDQKMTVRSANLADRTLDAQIKRYNDQAEIDQQKIEAAATANAIEYSRIDASASRAYGWLIDRAGNVIKGKDGKPIPVKTYGSSGKTKTGLTPYQMTQQYGRATEAAASMYYGSKDVDGKRVPANEAAGFDPDNSDTWGTGAVRYPEAMKRLTRMGIARPQAAAILNEHYDRGDTGRPIFTNDEARMIKGRLKKQLGAKEAERTWNATIRAITDHINRHEDDLADHRINELLAFLR